MRLGMRWKAPVTLAGLIKSRICAVRSEGGSTGLYSGAFMRSAYAKTV
jgi:hypothetical protein